MQKACAVISALFRCGIVGGWYGVALGLVYCACFAMSGAIMTRDLGFLDAIPVMIPFGFIFGFPAGFISGVLGGSLGGPIGYGIGGLIGTGATMVLFFGSTEGYSSTTFVIYPSIWGAAFGLVLGLHIRRWVPLFPGVEWLAESIYSSPLGGWLGWRQRHVT